MVCDDADDSAAPEGGDGFADHALISLHCLRIYLDTSYRMTIDLLREMPRIIGSIGLERDDLPHPSTLCKALDRIEMGLCRVLLRQSAHLHDLGDTVGIDATYFERDRASRHYCRRTEYCIQTLEATTLVDTDTQAILDVHCTTTRDGSDAEVCSRLVDRYPGEVQVLVADKGYDCQWLRADLRDRSIRPLIKHRLHAPYDHAHNARIDGDRYGQRAMCETVFSSVKRTLGADLRSRAWYREFREIALTCCVYNIKRAVKQ